jgi:hypothetical protein
LTERNTSRKKVLVLGGTGHFGRLLVEDLRRHTDCELIVAGHDLADLWNPASLESVLTGVSVAICAAGPFQTLPTTLVELCLRKGIHYIDLADDRSFVRKVRSLVSPDDQSLPAICSGWSTVSALSGLLARIGCAGSRTVDSIYIHMAPGNCVPRSVGTIASLLYSVGQKFNVFRNGSWNPVRGWSGKRHFLFPAPIGRRGGYLVDVPDHEFFPDLFHARTVEFRTGAELRILNFAVSSLSWFVRAGLVRSWVSWSRIFQRAAALLGFIGHDWGGVGVEVAGPHGRLRVSVIAPSSGQAIAVMPACVMTASLLSGSAARGPVSPADWLTREELTEECNKRGFRLIVEKC